MPEPLAYSDQKYYLEELPPIFMEVLKFPFVNIPYEELRRYIKIEFAMRFRYLNDDGSYGGYYHKYISSAKQCTMEDFKGINVDNP